MNNQQRQSRAEIIERGPEIGKFMDSPIWEYLKTKDGRFWTFDRTYPNPDADQLQLAADECWVYPGLCYRKQIIH